MFVKSPASLVAAFMSLAMLCGAPAAFGKETLVAGSKRFTESYILGDIVAQTARKAGADAEHRPGLGNTAVVLEALKTGAIDVYPEYLGTIEQEILKLPAGSKPELIRERLHGMGLAMGVPLGFSNSYALATTAQVAQKNSLQTIGDLKAQPQLRVAISQEFLGRADGWPGLSQRYGLTQKPTSIDHGLSYQALATSRIDVTDIYTTDAKIEELGLVTLRDDAGYFPRYDAVLLYREDLPTRAPAAWKAIAALEGKIDVKRMIGMNADAELRGKPFATIAKDFVQGNTATATSKSSLMAAIFNDDFWRLTREHLSLVGISVLLAVVIGVPLGILAARRRWSQWIFGAVGLLQTIPSLALLAALIPLLGRIGAVPATVALTLYALLPIVRNTAVGLLQVPEGIRQAAIALGMNSAQTLKLVQLPLALPVIVAGVKTATVMTIGTATIAAFIGAGGYGERIAQGLALNDGTTMLAGAIPSAVLALIAQGLFELLERMTGKSGSVT